MTIRAHTVPTFCPQLQVSTVNCSDAFLQFIGLTCL
jgi:hypothetical protein